MLPGEAPGATLQSVPGLVPRSSTSPVVLSLMAPQLSFMSMNGPTSWVEIEPSRHCRMLPPPSPVKVPAALSTLTNGIGQPGCSVPWGPWVGSLCSGSTPPTTSRVVAYWAVSSKEISSPVWASTRPS